MAPQHLLKTEFTSSDDNKVEFRSSSVELSKRVEKKDERIICTMPARERPEGICKLPVPESREDICELPREDICSLPARKPDEKSRRPGTCGQPFVRGCGYGMIVKQFACEYPSTEPNVNRVTYPLPFPEELEEVIGWADAFVDRVASLTADRKRENSREIRRLDDKVEVLEVLLAKAEAKLRRSREETEVAKTEMQNARDELSKVQTQALKKDAEIKGLNSRMTKAAATEHSLRDEIKKLMEKLADPTERNALRLAQAQVESERKAKQDALDKLNALECKVRELEIALEGKKKLIRELEARLSNVHILLDKARQDKAVLGAQKEELQKKHDSIQRTLEAETMKNSALLEEESKSKARIAQLDADQKKAAADITTLETEVESLKKEKEAAVAKSAQLQSGLEAATKGAEELSAKLQHSETEIRQAINAQHIAEEQKAGIDEELKEARRQLTAAWDKNNRQNQSEKDKIDGIFRAGQISPERLKELEDKEQRVDNLVSQLTTAQKSLIPFPAGKNINILSFEYGGTAYTDGSHTDVLNKLYENAEKGTKFTIDNKFVGKDPYVGVRKTYSITYQLQGDGVVHHLYGKEHDTKGFCLPAKK